MCSKDISKTVFTDTVSYATNLPFFQFIFTGFAECQKFTLIRLVFNSKLLYVVLFFFLTHNIYILYSQS